MNTGAELVQYVRVNTQSIRRVMHCSIRGLVNSAKCFMELAQ